MRKIFIDTGCWIALNNIRDKYHKHAVFENKKLLSEGCFYVTSDYVLDETYTLLRYDVGHKRAIEFGHEIKTLKERNKIFVVHITDDLLKKAWDIFEKYSDKDFSFTDCTSFTIMNDMKIKKVFCFDKHFEQYGFIKLPFIKN